MNMRVSRGEDNEHTMAATSSSMVGYSLKGTNGFHVDVGMLIYER
jgi:hypothetical protein